MIKESVMFFVELVQAFSDFDDIVRVYAELFRFGSYENYVDYKRENTVECKLWKCVNPEIRDLVLRHLDNGTVISIEDLTSV